MLLKNRVEGPARWNLARGYEKKKESMQMT